MINYIITMALKCFGLLPITFEPAFFLGDYNEYNFVGS